MAAVAVVLLVMRMGHHLVALVVLMLGQKLLQQQDSGCDDGGLGQEQTLDGGESDDGKEQGDERLDLQLQESQDGEELLQLLLLATTWEIERLVKN